MAMFHPEIYLDNTGVVVPDIQMNKTDSESNFGTVQVPVASDQSKERNGKKWPNKGNKRKSKASQNNVNKDIQKVLTTWYLNNKDTKQITDEMLTQKAEAIAKQLGLQQYSCQPQWLDTFKRQCNAIRPGYGSVATGQIPNISQLFHPTTSGASNSHVCADPSSISLSDPVSLAETHQALTTAITYLTERPSAQNRSSISILWRMIEDIWEEAKSRTSEAHPVPSAANTSSSCMLISGETTTVQNCPSVPVTGGNLPFQGNRLVKGGTQTNLGGTPSWMEVQTLSNGTIT